MLGGDDLVGLRAAQHVDDMGGAIHLAGAGDDLEQLPRLFRRILQHHRSQADIAIAAGLRLLAEIAQQMRRRQAEASQ